MAVRPSNLDTLKPADVFNLIIDDNVLKLLVEETNRYTEQLKPTTSIITDTIIQT